VDHRYQVITRVTFKDGRVEYGPGAEVFTRTQAVIDGILHSSVTHTKGKPGIPISDRESFVPNPVDPHRDTVFSTGLTTGTLGLSMDVIAFGSAMLDINSNGVAVRDSGALALEKFLTDRRLSDPLKHFDVGCHSAGVGPCVIALRDGFFRSGDTLILKGIPSQIPSDLLKSTEVKILVLMSPNDLVSGYQNGIDERIVDGLDVIILDTGTASLLSPFEPHLDTNYWNGLNDLGLIPNCALGCPTPDFDLNSDVFP
jgi:hypothetical protein